MSKIRYPVSVEERVRWEAIRAQFRRRRIELGLRQVDVAEHMGRSQDYVSILENSQDMPHLRTVWLWADALGIRLRFDVEQEESAPHTRAMPNGTERPGEHWNARLIREAAERSTTATAPYPTGGES